MSLHAKFQISISFGHPVIVYSIFVVALCTIQCVIDFFLIEYYEVQNGLKMLAPVGIEPVTRIPRPSRSRHNH